MYNHTPKNYACPFCRIIRQGKDLPLANETTDVIFQDLSATALLGLGRWENNPVNPRCNPAAGLFG
jgi:hypothetical protein